MDLIRDMHKDILKIVHHRVLYFTIKVEGDEYFILYMHHIIFICLPINGHLGCFHISAVMNINMVELFLIFFVGPPDYFPSWLDKLTFPSVMGSLFTTSSAAPVTSCLLDDSHSNRWEVITHCGFDLHFPVD